MGAHCLAQQLVFLATLLLLPQLLLAGTTRYYTFNVRAVFLCPYDRETSSFSFDFSCILNI
jgi:hypothetical protein